MNEYYQKNKDILREYGNEYYKNNKECYRLSSRKQHADKYGIDPIFTIKRNLRSRIKMFFKTKTKSTSKLIGCNWNELKKHLESKFIDNMNWENYGYYGWHIDHIKPLSSAQTKEEMEMLCHYTNLQPLWWRDNLQKSNKILEDTNN
jgi:hypothetical protein